MDFESLRDLKTERLRRSELDKELRFDGVVDDLNRIRTDILIFEDKWTQLSHIEQGVVSDINEIFLQIVGLIDGFSHHSTESKHSVIEKRRVILEKLASLNTIFIERIFPIICRIEIKYLKDRDITNADIINKKITESQSLLNTKISIFETSFTQAIENFNKKSSEQFANIKNEVENSRKIFSEATKIKQEAENFSVDKLVEKYGDIFLKQANKNKWIAIVSLILFSIGIVVVILLAYYLFLPLIEEITTFSTSNKNNSIEYVIVGTIFRLVLLSLAYIFIKEALRNFNSNMHLYNINLHRQNSLQSFSTLISQTSDHQVRNQIIKDISQTIYSGQDDGYIRSEKKNISVTEITELIKALR